MNLEKIKNLIKQNGDKVILVENGEPEVVLMSFQEYEKLSKNSAGEKPLIREYLREEKIEPNKKERSRPEVGLGDLEGEKLQETEFVVPLGGESTSLPVRLEDMRLEDLPI